MLLLLLQINLAKDIQELKKALRPSSPHNLDKNSEKETLSKVKDEVFLKREMIL